MSDLRGAEVTWLGHATVLIKTGQGTTILVDPFLEHNPRFPRNFSFPATIDLILLTHGHSDHIADAVPMAKKHGATVVAMVELAQWVASQGVEKTVGMNLGGAYSYKDVKATLVDAKHSTGIDDGGKHLYGGVAAGFVLELAGGPTLYHAGDTDVFGDMQILRELFTLDLAMLPIGDHYTMGPKRAALAVKYLSPAAVLPIHYGTFPVLTGRPEELEALIRPLGVPVRRLEPGETLR